MKKILIIDEKDKHSDGTGSDFYKRVNERCKGLIELATQIQDKVEILNDVQVKLNFDSENYEWVFFHDSYNDKNLDEGQLEDFKSKLKNYVLFSGGKTPDYALRITSRALLFSNLENVLNAYQKTLLFPVKVLFDPNYNLYYPLLDKLEDLLIEYNDIMYVLNSPELNKWLTILNYSEEEIKLKILPRYATLSRQQLFEKVEDWRRKNI